MSKTDRYITVPATMTIHRDLLNTEGTQPLPFGSHFVCKILLNDLRFGGGESEAYKKIAMRDAFLTAQPGDVVKLRGDECDLLKAIATKPTFKGGGYDPELGYQLVEAGYIDAIKNAATEDPREKEEPVEEPKPAPVSEPPAEEAQAPN